MKTIYTSKRPDSEFRIVEVYDGSIYAVDEDISFPGAWAKYFVSRTEKFFTGDEFISVSPSGEIEKIEADMNDCVFFGDFEFNQNAESPEDLF